MEFWHFLNRNSRWQWLPANCSIRGYNNREKKEQLLFDCEKRDTSLAWSLIPVLVWFSFPKRKIFSSAKHVGLKNFPGHDSDMPPFSSLARAWHQDIIETRIVPSATWWKCSHQQPKTKIFSLNYTKVSCRSPFGKVDLTKTRPFWSQHLSPFLLHKNKIKRFCWLSFSSFRTFKPTQKRDETPKLETHVRIYPWISGYYCIRYVRKDELEKRDRTFITSTYTFDGTLWTHLKGVYGRLSDSSSGTAVGTAATSELEEDDKVRLFLLLDHHAIRKDPIHSLSISLAPLFTHSFAQSLKSPFQLEFGRMSFVVVVVAVVSCNRRVMHRIHGIYVWRIMVGFLD